MTESGPSRSRPTVLLVEDDKKTAATVALYLRHAGMRVIASADGIEGLTRATADEADLVILDRMLPGLDGATICERLREISNVPVIILTAMVGEHDRLRGFEVGADDYVVKPFSPRELVARVQAFLRRAEIGRERKAGFVRVGPLLMDPNGREAWVGPTLLELTPTEYRLLYVLARSAGRVFSRSELVDEAALGRDVDVRVIDAHIKNLRRKLSVLSNGTEIIRTVPTLGYKVARDPLRA